MNEFQPLGSSIGVFNLKLFQSLAIFSLLFKYCPSYSRGSYTAKSNGQEKVREGQEGKIFFLISLFHPLFIMLKYIMKGKFIERKDILRASTMTVTFSHLRFQDVFKSKTQQIISFVNRNVLLCILNAREVLNEKINKTDQVSFFYSTLESFFK